jgi:thiamine biosynthesis lipoprotein
MIFSRSFENNPIIHDGCGVRGMMGNRLLGVFFLCVFGIISGCQPQKLHRETRLMMGTYVEVIAADARALPIVFNEVKRIELLMSKYIPSSEIYQLNQRGEAAVSQETFEVIKKAKGFWEGTAGAFDVTVGPLMDMWGFTKREYTVPGEETIKNALKRVGMDKVIMNDSDRTVHFMVPGMEIDLGGLGKGFAVDAAVAALRRAGIKRGVVNVGGHIYCLGDKFGKPWRIAIQDPHESGTVSGYVNLINKAIATSGDYEQFFMHGKKRYTHIMNPQTGYPVESHEASVTVIAPDCLTADALATSIFVLGKEKGVQFAQSFPGVEVKIIEK